MAPDPIPLSGTQNFADPPPKCTARSSPSPPAAHVITAIFARFFYLLMFPPIPPFFFSFLFQCVTLYIFRIAFLFLYESIPACITPRFPPTPIFYGMYYIREPISFFPGLFSSSDKACIALTGLSRCSLSSVNLKFNHKYSTFLRDSFFRRSSPASYFPVFSRPSYARHPFFSYKQISPVPTGFYPTSHISSLRHPLSRTRSIRSIFHSPRLRN